MPGSTGMRDAIVWESAIKMKLKFKETMTALESWIRS